MKKINLFAMVLAIVVLGLGASAQAISLTVGSGNYYVSVGDHDYLPYAYNAYPGFQPNALSFQAAMADYGQWVPMQPFGNVWRPFVAEGWRPYTEGHWTYTQYGPTWVGYEPWAWAAYHYGNWVYSQQMGWVWIPSYDYTPGRVAWAQGYNSLGWMPMPPAGYDYSRGYLAYVGPTNQFTYGDRDFSIGIGIGSNNYYYGGPYYDPRYRDMYYNPSYLNSAAGLLWTFIDANNYTSDNYADYYYGGDYAQQLFSRRLVRISTQPLDRVIVERIVGQPVQVRQVRVNQISVDGKPVRLVAVEGEEQDVRKNANRVVRDVIAPAFAEKGRNFKGPEAKGQKALNRVLNDGVETPKVQTVNSDEIIREARQNHEQVQQRRAQLRQQRVQEVERVEKEGKIRERNAPPGQLKKEEDTRTRNSQVNPPGQSNRPAETPDRNRPDVTDQNQRQNGPDQQINEDQQNNPRNNRQKDQNPDRNQNKETNRPADRRTNENMTRPENPPGKPTINEDQQNNPRENRPDQVPPDRRANPDHSNMQPDSDQHQNERDENAVKNESVHQNSDRNANTKEDQSDKKSKKTKNNKSKKDKNNNNDDEPPPQK